MKKLLITLILLTTSIHFMQGQTKPKVKQTLTTTALQSKPQVSSSVKEYNVNGVTVLVKPALNEVVGVQLFISGGVNNFVKGKDGIEALCLSVLTDGGSDKYSKEKFHDITESKGIYISADAGYDNASISMRTTTKTWNIGWDIFQDMILHPAWNAESFEQLQAQTISGLMQQQSDPDETLRKMSIKGTFAGQRYEKDPEGTPETVKALTLDDLKAHYAKILQRKKIVIVVVGKVDASELIKRIGELKTVPEGVADKFISIPPKTTANALVIEERDIATNYIRGVFNAPAEGTREALAMRIAMSMLYDNMFIEVRTKRNLSYAPAAGMSGLYDPYCYLYVSTTKPNEAAQVMIDEVRRVKKEGFKDKELANKKEGFLTGYYMGQETNSSQAASLGANALKTGWQKSETIRSEVESLTTKEVNDVFRKYATNIKWYYLGDKSLIDEKIFKQGL